MGTPYKKRRHSNVNGEWDDDSPVQEELPIEKTIPVTTKPAPVPTIPIRIDPAELADNEFEVNFHNPDLSKLPKEIPIPQHVSSDIVRQQSCKIAYPSVSRKIQKIKIKLKCLVKFFIS